MKNCRYLFSSGYYSFSVHVELQMIHVHLYTRLFPSEIKLLHAYGRLHLYINYYYHKSPFYIIGTPAIKPYRRFSGLWTKRAKEGEDSLNFIRLLRVVITRSVAEGVITTQTNRMKFRLRGGRKKKDGLQLALTNRPIASTNIREMQKISAARNNTLVSKSQTLALATLLLP